MRTLIERKYLVSVEDLTQEGNVIHVLTPKERFVLKQYPLHSNLAFQFQVLRHLSKQHFLSIPSVVLTQDQDLPFFKYQEFNYVLLKWIPGRKCDLSQTNELCHAAMVLASLHNYSSNLTLEKVSHIPSQFSATPNFFNVKIGQYKSSTVMKKLLGWKEDFSFDWLDCALALMEESIRRFPVQYYHRLYEREKEETAFSHGDYNSSNLVLSPDGAIKVIDFDDCSLNIRITDLVFLLQLHMGVDIKNVVKVLAAYNSVRKLSIEEFEVTKALLFMPARCYWEMHVRTYLHQEVTQKWLNMAVTPYVNLKYYNSLEHLTYDCISP